MKTRILLMLIGCVTLMQGYAQTHSKSAPHLFTSEDNGGRGSGTFLYNLTTLNEPYVELSGAISINNGEVWDDPAYSFPVDFPFELNGNPITFLEFDGVGAFLRSATANPDVDTYVFPFENDLIDRGYEEGISISPISYIVEGVPGSRILKMEMKNTGSYLEWAELGTTNMYISFQMWLHEGSNVVEFRFGESMINNPSFFYDNGGAYAGIADYNFVDDIVINPHFLGGPASAPELNVSDVTLEGTPAEGTVYRLSPNVPVEVEVIGTNSTSFCNPNGTATAVVTGGVAPFSYLWNNAETTAMITGLDAGTYSVTVTDSEGSSAVGSVTITNVGPVNPNAFATDETAVDANDGTATSAAFGGSPPYSFAWSNGENTQMITGLAPGNYTVTVTDSEGCTGTQTVTVNAFECIGLEIEAVITNASCSGVCDGLIFVEQVLGGSPPYLYIWSNGSASNPAGDLCAGDYSLTILDANGCVVEASFVVTEPAIIQVNAVSTNETSPGANDGTATAAPTGGTAPYTYLWSNGGTESQITNLAPGTYTVTVTDDHGCTATQSVDILEFQCTGTVIPGFTNPSCFNLCDGTASVFVSGGNGPYSYQWSNLATSDAISGLCEGTFIVTITDAGGNCIYTEIFELTQPDSLQLTVDQIMHYNNLITGSISITVAGGTPPYAYTWSGPNGYTNTQEDISGLSPGFYTVVVADANGCVLTGDPVEIRDETVGTKNVANLDIRVYPNPAKDIVYLDIENINGFRIQLMSLDGRRMRLWDSERILNMEDVPAGIYLLEGVSGDGIFRKQISVVR